MKRTTRVIIVMVTLCLAEAGKTQSFDYPPSRQVDVVDDYQDVKISDPYRWLEDLNSTETKAWINAQNAIAIKYLESLPLREVFRKRITELWNYPKVSLPRREGGRLWYRRNSGLERQSVVYSRRDINAPRLMVIDPNQLSPDGSISLAQIAPSPNGKFLAYTLSEGGADWQTIHVRDLTTGRDTADRVDWVRFSRIAWTHDGKGFFYSRFPTPPQGKHLEAALGIHSLHYHVVGTPQSKIG